MTRKEETFFYLRKTAYNLFLFFFFFFEVNSLGILFWNSEGVGFDNASQ